MKFDNPVYKKSHSELVSIIAYSSIEYDTENPFHHADESIS